MVFRWDLVLGGALFVGMVGLMTEFGQCALTVGIKGVLGALNFYVHNLVFLLFF